MKTTSNTIVLKNDGIYMVFKVLLGFLSTHQHNCSILGRDTPPLMVGISVTAEQISYSLEYCSSELSIRHNSYLQDVKFAADSAFMILFYRITKVAYTETSQRIQKKLLEVVT